jgi:hypothetical protein
MGENPVIFTEAKLSQKALEQSGFPRDPLGVKKGFKPEATERAQFKLKYCAAVKLFAR